MSSLSTMQYLEHARVININCAGAQLCVAFSLPENANMVGVRVVAHTIFHPNCKVLSWLKLLGVKDSGREPRGVNHSMFTICQFAERDRGGKRPVSVKVPRENAKGPSLGGGQTIPTN